MTTFLPALSSSAARLERLAPAARRSAAARPTEVWPGTICIDDSLVRRPSGPGCPTGHGQVRDAPRREGRPAGDVDQLAGVLRPQDHLVVGGDVLEQLEDVDLLLVVRADQVVVGVPGDRQHRGAVELGVVEAVEQVDGPRAAGGEADAQPAGELGVAAGGERRRLLVAALDEADLVLVLAQGLEDPVDPVAGEAEDRVHAPVDQLLDDHVARRLRHLSASSGCERASLHRTRRIATARRDRRCRPNRPTGGSCDRLVESIEVGSYRAAPDAPMRPGSRMRRETGRPHGREGQDLPLDPRDRARRTISVMPANQGPRAGSDVGRGEGMPARTPMHRRSGAAARSSVPGRGSIARRPADRGVRPARPARRRPDGPCRAGRRARAPAGSDRRGSGRAAAPPRRRPCRGGP